MKKIISEVNYGLFVMILCCWKFDVSEAAATVNKRSLADNIQSGIKFAGKILGQ